mmetsp:Transcript_67130/g.194335  ORF Transcript_67130/g.194335 Transcript_67130/m.194335 type:complete len:290 (-) Transcript_67130:1105-1974(-)
MPGRAAVQGRRLARRVRTRCPELGVHWRRARVLREGGRQEQRGHDRHLRAGGDAPAPQPERGAVGCDNSVLGTNFNGGDDYADYHHSGGGADARSLVSAASFMARRRRRRDVRRLHGARPHAALWEPLRQVLRKLRACMRRRCRGGGRELRGEAEIRVPPADLGNQRYVVHLPHGQRPREERRGVRGREQVDAIAPRQGLADLRQEPRRRLVQGAGAGRDLELVHGVRRRCPSQGAVVQPLLVEPLQAAGGPQRRAAHPAHGREGALRRDGPAGVRGPGEGLRARGVVR